MTSAQLSATWCTHPSAAQNTTAATVYRPMVEVFAEEQGIRHRVMCLVDTGADDTVLDLGTAAVLNIDLNTLSASGVTTASGTTQMSRHPGLSLTFVGATVVVPVLFAAVAAPLLGRSAFLDANLGMSTLFDATSWSHT